ncbi:MAG: hypothetical protein U9O53_04260, partial [archaeon]|nr:hypothetical protein [archaeon]
MEYGPEKMNMRKVAKKSAEREIILILIASMLLVTASSVLISAQGFVQMPYYFHWLDTPIDVGEVYNQSRVFNVTGPLLATAHEEVGNSNDLGLLGNDYDFYLTPELSADLNVSGVQTFSLWMEVSRSHLWRDQVSAKTEILDFDPVTDAYVSLGISSAQHIGVTDYTEYKYNISVESVVAKGHRIVARVHAFESIDNGGRLNRNVEWSFAYDSSIYNSYVNLSAENVFLTVNLTEPYIEEFSSPASEFNITCNVSCDHGSCKNVTVYPQYCSGLSCTSFVNMDNETGGLVTSELSHFWSEVGDDEVLSYSFEITSSINNHYSIRCNATADNVFANISDTSARVSVAELNITYFDHENNNEYDVEEYEAGDVIDWINATVLADNNASFSNVSLNVLDSAGSSAGWGPDEKYECGLVENQSYCNATYTNSSNGYSISDAAGSGTYLWNVTYLWLGGFKENTSTSFSLHNLVQDNFTAAVNFTKIAVGEAVEYNFTIGNPWSKNLTSVNVTFNCPS